MKHTVIVTIVLVLLSAGGTLAAPPAMGPVEVVAAHDGHQFQPEAAYNSSRQEFMVVWSEEVAGIHQIWGRRVDRDGAPIGAAFAITDAATDQFSPDIAYDPIHDRYLVVWVDDYSGTLSDTDIAGRLIPWDGPSASLAAFPVYAAANGQWTPAAVFVPGGSGEFFLVWCNVTAGSASIITGQRWRADGSGTAAPPITVAGDETYHRINPTLVFNPDTSQLLVVYERWSGATEEDVFATRLTWSGSVLGGEIGIAAFTAEENQIDVASCGETYLVTWKGDTGANADIYTRILAADGTVGAIHNLTGDLGAAKAWPRAECSPASAGYLVAWEQGFSNGLSGVVAATVNAGGGLVDRFNVRASNQVETMSFTRPSLVGDGAGSCLTVFEADRPDLSSQDIAARVLGLALFGDGFESGDTGAWSALVP